MYDYRHGGNVHAEPGGENYLDFSAAINPLGPPKQVEAAVREAMRFINRYPDSQSIRLRKSLAEFEHVPAEWILCGNGSSDLLFRLPRAVNARSGLVLRPTFSDYERALTANHASVFFHRLDEKNGFLCDESILDTMKTTPSDLLFLCNPNNPTGIPTKRSVIERILQSAEKSDATVVIDECFMDLTDKSEDFTAKPLLKSFKNLVVLKALTKTFALPGLRLGYAICSDPDLIDRLQFSGPDWPVSNLAQSAGVAALKNAGPYLKQTRVRVEHERRFVKNELEKLGYRVVDGRANYLLAKNPHALDLKEELNKRLIRIRCFSDEEGLGPDFFRIGLSTRENNMRLIEALREITGKKRGET